MRDGKEGGLSEGRARGIQWLKGWCRKIHKKGEYARDQPPFSPAEFLPARPEGVSSKHRKTGKLVLSKNQILYEFGGEGSVECCLLFGGSSHPMMMMPWM